jgi:hypothetical protein
VDISKRKGYRLKEEDLQPLQLWLPGLRAASCSPNPLRYTWRVVSGVDHYHKSLPHLSSYHSKYIYLVLLFLFTSNISSYLFVNPVL